MNYNEIVIILLRVVIYTNNFSRQIWQLKQHKKTALATECMILI